MVPAVSGNKYIFVLYDFDSNYIFAVPIMSRKKEEIIKAYKQVFVVLTRRELKPKIKRLDNEASAILRVLTRETRGSKIMDTACY